MTSMPVDLHKNPGDRVSGPPAIPEPWTWHDTLLFSGWGVVIFSVLFGFMFALGDM